MIYGVSNNCSRTRQGSDVTVTAMQFLAPLSWQPPPREPGTRSSGASRAVCPPGPRPENPRQHRAGSLGRGCGASRPRPRPGAPARGAAPAPPGGNGQGSGEVLPARWRRRRLRESRRRAPALPGAVGTHRRREPSRSARRPLLLV